MYDQGKKGVEQSDSDAVRGYGRAAAQDDEKVRQKYNAVLQKRRGQQRGEGGGEEEGKGE